MKFLSSSPMALKNGCEFWRLSKKRQFSFSRNVFLIWSICRFVSNTMAKENAKEAETYSEIRLSLSAFIFSGFYILSVSSKIYVLLE